MRLSNSNGDCDRGWTRTHRQRYCTRRDRGLDATRKWAYNWFYFACMVHYMCTRCFFYGILWIQIKFFCFCWNLSAYRTTTIRPATQTNINQMKASMFFYIFEGRINQKNTLQFFYTIGRGDKMLRWCLFIADSKLQCMAQPPCGNLQFLLGGRSTRQFFWDGWIHAR